MENDFTTFSYPPLKDSCWHYYSNGTNQFDLFAEPEDKTFAMNLAAILAHDCGIRICCVQIMTTHLHLILRGPQQKCQEFDMRFKAVVKRHLSRKDIRYNPIITSLDPIGDEREFMSLFAYVYKNALSAGAPVLPHHYLWGPGDVFFSPENIPAGTRIGDLSENKRLAVLGTTLSCPQEWAVDTNGRILPKCYIDNVFCEQVFATPLRFLAFMSMSRKEMNTIRIQCNSRLVKGLTDKDLRHQANEACKEYWHKPLAQCLFNEKLEIVKRFWEGGRGFTLRQLARAFRVEPGVLESLLK